MVKSVRTLHVRDLVSKVIPGPDKSGHPVSIVDFIDIDGVKKTGFSKPVDGTYPPPLVLTSVSTSCFARYLLGNERAARDMLVTDDHKQILGSLSVAIPDYKHLLGTSLLVNIEPTDPEEREQVCPSVETLMRENIAELLVVAWYLGNDDLHPENMSLKALIDWDMYFYWLTHAMKGDRATDKNPAEAVRLLAKHILNFPLITGRTHWPANTYPGNYNYQRRFASASEFWKLINNPEIVVEGRAFPVCFQEQVFEAILKCLLLFDPDVLLARLEEYVGGYALSYFDLPKDKRAVLEKEHPGLFKPAFNHKLFTNHIMEVFQLNYDNLSRAALFFMGDINSEGQSVPGFYQFLESRPSALKRILAFVNAQNAEIDAEEAAKESEAESSIPSAPTKNKTKHNVNFIVSHYHKIWRDAHTGVIRKALDDLKTLQFRLARQIQSLINSQDQESDHALFSVVSAPGQSSDLGETGVENLVTEAWQIIGEPPLNEHQNRDNLGAGSSLLEQMIHRIHRASHDYYKLALTELTVDANKAFIKQLYKIVHKYQENCLPLLDDEFSIRFSNITMELKRFCNNFDLEEHLRSEDKPFPIKILSASKEQIARHLEPDIIQEGLQVLFSWVNTLEKDTHRSIFNAFILEIIETDYEPQNVFETWTSNRQRAEKIRAYLKDDRYANQANSLRLATILSEGGRSFTSLNTKIINGLIGVMLDSIHGIADDMPAFYLNSLREVYALESFNAVVYTEHAVDYVLQDAEFAEVPGNVHYWNNIGQRLYEWINAAGLDTVRSIMQEGLATYTSRNFMDSNYVGIALTMTGFFGSSKKGSIDKIIKELRPNNLCLQVSLVLKETGQINTSSNWCLMESLLAAIKKDVSTNPEKRNDPKYKFLLLADMSGEKGTVLLSKMSAYANKYFEDYQNGIAGGFKKDYLPGTMPVPGSPLPSSSRWF